MPRRHQARRIPSVSSAALGRAGAHLVQAIDNASSIHDKRRLRRSPSPAQTIGQRGSGAGASWSHDKLTLSKQTGRHRASRAAARRPRMAGTSSVTSSPSGAGRCAKLSGRVLQFQATVAVNGETAEQNDISVHPKPASIPSATTVALSIGLKPVKLIQRGLNDRYPRTSRMVKPPSTRPCARSRPAPGWTSTIPRSRALCRYRLGFPDAATRLLQHRRA